MQRILAFAIAASGMAIPASAQDELAVPGAHGRVRRKSNGPLCGISHWSVFTGSIPTRSPTS